MLSVLLSKLLNKTQSTRNTTVTHRWLAPTKDGTTGSPRDPRLREMLGHPPPPVSQPPRRNRTTKRRTSGPVSCVGWPFFFCAAPSHYSRSFWEDIWGSSAP